MLLIIIIMIIIKFRSPFSSSRKSLAAGFWVGEITHLLSLGETSLTGPTLHRQTKESTDMHMQADTHIHTLLASLPAGHTCKLAGSRACDYTLI